jgi:hypothetical protein
LPAQGSIKRWAKYKLKEAISMAQRDASSGRYEIRPDDKRDNRTFDDPLGAAKYLRSFLVRGAAVELLVNGRIPTTKQVETINQALEKLNDELPKFLIFKHEDDRDGVPEGPVSIGPDPEQFVLYGEAAIRGESWRPRCRCEEPSGEHGETCDECGGQVRVWLTLPAAEEKAKELGLEVWES